MTPETAVSFDLDGTLITGPFTRVLTDLDAELATEPGGEGAKRDILARHKQLLGTDVLAAYDWQSIVAERLAARHLTAPFDLLDRLNDHLRDGTRFLHDDTLALLTRLREQGVRVTVLTNGWRRYQTPVLRSAGLLEVVDELITSDDCGAPKPDRAMFDAARDGAGNHVHVGDRIDHDVVGGNAAGVRTVLLRADVPLHGSVAGHEDELTGYLHQLEASEGAPPGVAPATSRYPTRLASTLREVVDWVLG